MNYSRSRRLIQNTKNFLNIKYYSLLDKLQNKSGIFYGWGHKKLGLKAVDLAKKFHTSFVLLEDGFIRSLGLGVNGSPSFSLVEDDVGIYYDATTPSKLENILNTYDFNSNEKLMAEAKEAMALMINHNVSKYNDASLKIPDKVQNDSGNKILVIAQTAGDASLKYGMLDDFSTDEMIDAAIRENPDSKVYLKVHPDVLSGKKESDIDLGSVKEKCIIIAENVNPISLLKQFSKVYTKTSGMGFEALLVGCECVCFGMPFYAGWGVTDDRSKCERRKRKLSVEEIFAAAYILYTRYYNPYKKKESDIFDTIHEIIHQKQLLKENSMLAGSKVKNSIFLGFSTWKHAFVKPFLPKDIDPIYINPWFQKNTFSLAKKRGLDENSSLYLWGKKSFAEIEQYADENKIDVYHVEDGFIRSVGLGSDLTQPYSLVIDSKGIYFDPTEESDLEHLLNHHQFTESELARAKLLRQELIEKKLSKYNNYDDVNLDTPKDKKVVLVPGQVEDDASIRFGAQGMTNLALLQHARENAPDAYIIFKPHPDVLAGNRVGNVEQEEALKFCDRVVTEVSLDSVLSLCDEVHTMTSLVGFEALMRDIKVFTYGLPFYAGWGLSEDTQVCARRKRTLDIDELTAATLILYPQYIDPLTKEPCEVEVTLIGLEKEKEKLASSFVYRVSTKTRNLVSRKSQQIFRIFH